MSILSPKFKSSGSFRARFWLSHWGGGILWPEVLLVGTPRAQDRPAHRDASPSRQWCRWVPPGRLHEQVTQLFCFCFSGPIKVPATQGCQDVCSETGSIKSLAHL